MSVTLTISTIMKEYSGTVVRGDGRGKQLGYPTANIDITQLSINIEPGVYGAEVSLDQTNWIKGILFFGPKKTFDKVENTLEIHIFDFDKDIYDQKLFFNIGQFIRGPKKFNSVEELISQIKTDISKLDKDT